MSFISKHCMYTSIYYINNDMHVYYLSKTGISNIFDVLFLTFSANLFYFNVVFVLLVVVVVVWFGVVDLWWSFVG